MVKKAIGTLVGGAMVGALVVSSCSGEDELPAHLRAEGCVLASDCNNPLVCTFQRCHGVCKETRDCEKDETCLKLPEGNVCRLPVESACIYTSQCPAPLKCA